jgi:hypothetical protein
LAEQLNGQLEQHNRGGAYFRLCLGHVALVRTASGQTLTAVMV